MEDFILFILVIAVLWLISRQRGQSESRQSAEDLANQIKRLEDRLAIIERAPGLATPPVRTTPLGPAPAQFNPAPAPPIPAPATSASVKFDPAFPGFSNPKPATPVAPAPQPPLTAKPSAAVQPFTPPSVPTPIASEAFASTPQRSISLEERFGQNWLNKLGIVILVLGIALFLGYQLHNLGPLGKSLIGLTLSIVVLSTGLLLERRDTYRIFARALIGGGWALIFFVTFALYHVTAMQVLHSQALDLVLMFVVAAAMVWHSLKYRSQVVTSLAFLLAFVTVGISEVTLFSLVAGTILAIGLIFIAAREYWFELALCGIIGVYLNHFLWLQRVLPNGAVPGHPFPELLPSAALLLTYWLLFRLFYVFRVPKNHRQEVIASLTAVLNSVGVMSLLKFQSSHPEWAFYGLLALGSAELVLAFIARPRFRTAFIVLSCIASALLLAAIPFHFADTSWSLLWLLESELLFLAGIAIKEAVFRRLGILAGFFAAGQLAIVKIFPLVELRQTQPDITHHLGVAATLISGALLIWFNSEFAPRCWKFIAVEEIDILGFDITTYLALAFAVTGLWVFFPGAWTVIAWLVVTLILGWAADALSSTALANQTDILALAAIIRVAIINFGLIPQPGHVSLRAITITLAAALLYANMRRKTHTEIFSTNYVPAFYSWVAAAFLATLAWYELQPVSVAVAWGVFGLTLFELGFNLRRSYLRHQAYALLAASFVRIFFANLPVGDGSHILSPRLYTVVPLIAAYFWIYQRLTSESTQPPVEKAAANIAAWAGLLATAALAYFEVRPEWIAIAWALLALLCLLTGWALKRTLFIMQSLVVVLAAAIRAMVFNIFTPTPLAAGTTSTRLFCVSLTCLLMLAALPLAFLVRKQHAGSKFHDWRDLTLFRPEQPFFFIPIVLVAVLLAVQLRAGMITIGWSALGVLTFLFALTVKERSYRLTGLALLMFGVAKILTVDIWKASPSDRYITLIVMGAALLLVSFLYSRYRDTLLKFL